MEFKAYGEQQEIIQKLVDNDENATIFFEIGDDYAKESNEDISVKYIDGDILDGLTVKGGIDKILDLLNTDTEENLEEKNIKIYVTTVLIVVTTKLNKLKKQLEEEPDNENLKEEIDNLDYYNKNLFPRECHSVFLICDKQNNTIYLYDPNGETRNKAWYYINNEIYKGCSEVKKLIESKAILFNNIIVPETQGIQTLPKGHNENNIIETILDYRPDTQYIDCGWCMFYNLFAMEYIIDNIGKKSLKNIYDELTKESSGMYTIFPMYCKESLAIEGTAHYYYEPNSIEKYSYELAIKFSDKLKSKIV